MVDPKLVEYVKNAFTLGFNSEQIIEKLVSSGYSLNDAEIVVEQSLPPIKAAYAPIMPPVQKTHHRSKLLTLLSLLFLLVAIVSAIMFFLQ